MSTELMYDFTQKLKSYRNSEYAKDKWIDMGEFALLICDKDKCGCLTKIELRQLTIKIGMKLTDKGTTSLFDAFNSSKNLTLFGYKVFNEEAITLKELHIYIKNEFTEQQFDYIANFFLQLNKDCSVDIALNDSIYTKIRPEKELSSVPREPIELTDFLAHTANLLQTTNNLAIRYDCFVRLFDEEWSYRCVTLEHIVYENKNKINKLVKTIDSMNKELDACRENVTTEIKKNNSLKLQLLDTCNQSVVELDALHNRMTELMTKTTSDLSIVKSKLNEERIVSERIANTLNDRIDELETLADERFFALEKANETITANEKSLQGLMTYNEEINGKLSIVTRENEQVCLVIERSYHEIKDICG